MHILGIANGSQGGNSEILLKAALTAATTADPSISTSWIHAPSISIPRNPKPLQGAQDISLGVNTDLHGANGTVSYDVPDDRAAVLNAILDADALIFATAVYSHQPAGFLKAVVDRIMGPFTDVAFARRALDAKAAGDARFQNVTVDARLLKPRVVGFLAVGGSTTPDQFSMALPTLHTMVTALHARVVDQAVLHGALAPGLVVVKDGGALLDRASLLGRNVASQMGKDFDDAEYLGQDEPGACRYCHLSKIELYGTQDNAVGCVTCGAKGNLVMGVDGVCLPVWREDDDVSAITMAGKLRHLDDIAEGSAKAKLAISSDQQFEEKLEYWRRLEVPVLPMPSNKK